MNQGFTAALRTAARSAAQTARAGEIAEEPGRAAAATSVPVAPIQAIVQHPAAPPPALRVQCSGYRKCASFNSCSEAQARFQARGYQKMDADHEGIACEGL